MNKKKRFLKIVSASAFMFLGWETLVLAENLPKPGNYSRSKDFLLTGASNVATKGQVNTRGYQKLPIQLSQSTEPETPTESVEDKSQDSQDNPLTFPTNPEEVQINIEQPITLEEAIELALRNNKDLQVAKLNLQRSEEELREARADLYPNLDAQVDLINQDTNRTERNEDGITIRDPQDPSGTTPLTSEGLATSASGTLALTYDIYSGGRISANIKRAESQLRLNELDLERITEVTRFEATRDYYSLQDADEQVKIAQSSIEDASQTLKDAQLLEQAGLGTRFDVLRAEVELANEQQQLNIAISNQRSAQRTLAETLSIGQQVQLTTADEIKEAGIWPLSLEETIVLAYQNRAEIEQQVVSRELNEQQRKIALAAIRPRVSLFADYTYTASDIFEEVEDFEERDNNRYRFGAQLNWALFDGGTAKARAAQSETDIEISETQFADQLNLVRLQVEQGYFALEANKENISTSRKAEELAEESLRLARLRFQAGVGTQTEVIDAQTGLTTARGNFLSAVIQYNQSLNQLRRAVTNLSDSDSP